MITACEINVKYVTQVKHIYGDDKTIVEAFFQLALGNRFHKK